MLGDKVTARRAHELGLATSVVSDEHLAQHADELAVRLASGPAFAYSATKSLLTRELDMDLGSAIELEAMTQALLMHSDDFAEFYEAWSEGRKPDWKGR
jgi:enoyl-CoA hydratase/carnithine racemase